MVHTPQEHRVLTQSFPCRQAFPAAQRLQLPPPQSTSVSVESFTPFVQFAVPQWPAIHAVCVQQSRLELQPLPMPQPKHEPPQSTSVSSPSFTPLWHVGGWHTFTSQSPLAHVLLVLHDVPFGHAREHGPPQSVPTSPPFRTPSVHVGV